MGSGLTGGTGSADIINVIKVSGFDIYAGGFFREIGGTSANSIAKWDGTSWSPLGSGLDIWEILVHVMQ